MLLIDPGRTAHSLRPNAVPFAYVMKDFRGDAGRAQTYLTRALDLDRLVPVLVRELSLLPGIGRVIASLAPMLLREAAAAIARGALPLAQKLPDRVTLLVEESDDTLVHAERAVRFASVRVAAGFLTALGVDAPTQARLDALKGGGGIDALARALMDRGMALVPMGDSLEKLRLVRVRHNIPAKSEEGPASLPALPANPVARLAQMAQAALPELPADLSAQARTLLDAAKNGVPFCEECAKAAAGLLGV